jgi:hypothetical protein
VSWFVVPAVVDQKTCMEMTVVCVCLLYNRLGCRMSYESAQEDRHNTEPYLPMMCRILTHSWEPVTVITYCSSRPVDMYHGHGAYY